MAGTYWADGDAYERYMGRWSRLVAESFVTTLDVAPDKRWLDVGCGTGALSSVILETREPASLTGVDPSEGFLESARARLGDFPRWERADATHLPLPDASIDAVVSGLVLNFVPSPEDALAEMTRVAEPGGLVAAYVWDYAAGMPLMSIFWDAAVALDPEAEALDQSVQFVRWQPEFMHELVAGTAGVDPESVSVVPIEVTARFDDFEDYWAPFLGGQGPAPAYVMSLDETARSALRARVQSALPAGPIELTLRAWAAIANLSA